MACINKYRVEKKRNNMNFSQYIKESKNKYGLSGEYGDTPEEVEDTLEMCNKALKANADIIKALEAVVKAFKKVPGEFRDAPGYNVHCEGYVGEALECAKEYQAAWQKGKREMEDELK